MNYDYFVKDWQVNKEISVEKWKKANYWNIKTCLRPDKWWVISYHWWIKNWKWIFINNWKVSIWTTDFDQTILSLPDINSLPTWSFILEVKIQLETPYYSADEDWFYPIDNPVKKEKILKRPYIPWSSWKGYLLSAWKKLVQKDFENWEYKEGIKKIFQLWRIFWAGGEKFELMIEKYENKSFKEFLDSFKNGLKDTETFDKALKDYLIFNIWIIKFGENKNIDFDNLEKEEPAVFWTRKWRLKILPNFFNQISLEVINPHNKRLRAWTKPIYFEVVPAGDIANLKMIYIPFDLIWLWKNKDEIQKEAKEDAKFICSLVEEAWKIWIWAKAGERKYNWGRYKIMWYSIKSKENI